MAQKSGEVIVSFFRGPGFSVHNLRPCNTSEDVFAEVSFGKLDTL
jgi:hypothetical protein